MSRFSFCLVAVSSLLAWAAHGAQPMLLRAEADIASHEVRLADLIETDRLSAAQVRRLHEQVVGPAPMLGQTLELSRGAVRQRLASAGIQDALGGAGAVKVHRRSQQVPPPALCEAALQDLRAQLAVLAPAVVSDARCAEGMAPVEVGGGALELRAQSTPADLLDGRHGVAVALFVEGRQERVVRVPVEIRAEAALWCASEAVAAGEPVLEGRFRACRSPVVRLEQFRTAGLPLPDGRLRHAVRAGEVLSSADVVASGVQLRGDAVTVLYLAGSLAVESHGELSQDARVGDTVRVQLRTGESVVGRLAQAQRVEVEEQP